ncbi:hypothetical protein L2E82_35105 [Cichorium intybus]|uniref:Uncharacterized protein n=1 Tax=Cichorium intybus TaxID=13427 RepID=A0ACB9BND4_CICIN|nr:hypothetical protein L2E82_35105 [Cichorium intybus]
MVHRTTRIWHKIGFAFHCDPDREPPQLVRPCTAIRFESYRFAVLGQFSVTCDYGLDATNLMGEQEKTVVHSGRRHQIASGKSFEYLLEDRETM